MGLQFPMDTGTLEATVTEETIKALVNHVEGSENGLTGDHDCYTTHIEVSSDELTQYWDITGGIETL